ncbi:MAG TPA: TolC family protein [Bryobacteraceae bacterium]|nr:TolC family protein [Bryobacteraceae bacterium]
MPNRNHRRKIRVVYLAVVCAGVVMAQPTPQPPALSLQEAETAALKNHPQILAAQNEAEYSGQQVTVARAPYFPVIAGDMTASAANIGSRIGAGYLTDSRLFNRYGQGITFNQLVTDLGRTKNLVASSQLNSQAAAQNVTATKYDVLLAVNRAYYGVLRAQAVVRVAQQTVDARQLLLDQVNALARNNLKSQLDVSFSEVSVSEAKLLVINAEDAVDEAYAELARAMGSDQVINYRLADEPLPPSPATAPDALIAQAMKDRPELASLNLSRESSRKFAEAEKDLSRPSVSLVGTAGYTPYIQQLTSQVIPPEYAGAAVNVNIPVFNGHLFSARREAANYRALEADQRLRDEQQRIARDVRVAWASAVTAFQRIDVTSQFLRQAALGLNLAQGRYNLGLSSIVELTQAQLSQTQAEIENLNAKYDYQTQNAALQYTIGALR